VASGHTFDLGVDVLVGRIHDKPCSVFSNSQIFGRSQFDEACAIHRAALAHEALETLASSIFHLEDVESVVHLPKQILVPDLSFDLRQGKTLPRRVVGLTIHTWATTVCFSGAADES
jgi:hypothetical protein